MRTTFLICAAGSGVRFAQLLPTIPKPLIQLEGKTLLEWSLASLPILPTDDVLIVTQAKDQIQAKLGEYLAAIYPFNDLKWLELDQPTRGQLDTVWQARHELDQTKSLTIYNSDSYFESPTLSPAIRLGSAAGIIPCSQQPGEAWSFCKIDQADRVLEVAEKVRISDWASVGLYFFRDTQRFLKLAEAELNTPQPSEYYVAPIYQRYLATGEDIRIDKLAVFKPMGTPEQIEKYWQVKPVELVRENQSQTQINSQNFRTESWPKTMLE